MRRFPDQNRLDKQLAAGHLERLQLLELANSIASFHQSLVSASTNDDHGKPHRVIRPVEENVLVITAALGAIDTTAQPELATTIPILMGALTSIEAWIVGVGEIEVQWQIDGGVTGTAPALRR